MLVEVLVERGGDGGLGGVATLVMPRACLAEKLSDVLLLLTEVDLLLRG